MKFFNKIFSFGSQQKSRIFMETWWIWKFFIISFLKMHQNKISRREKKYFLKISKSFYLKFPFKRNLQQKSKKSLFVCWIFHFQGVFPSNIFLVWNLKFFCCWFLLGKQECVSEGSRHNYYFKNFWRIKFFWERWI